MKKLLFTCLALATLAVSMPFCGKKGGTSDSCSTEKTLTVTTSPANGANEAAAPGPTFPLTVTIGSTLPTSGVTIQVKARPDGVSTTFFTEERSSTSASNSFTITGTPVSTTCVVEITVTSKTCATNKWTGSYRYSRK